MPAEDAAVMSKHPRIFLKPFQHSADSGAVMVLTVIFLGVLLAFMTIVIDEMRMGSVRQESQNHAGLAAISALEEFIASPPGFKHARAIERANTVSGFNMVLNTDHSDPVSENSNPKIEFGQWYFVNPVDNSTPCQGNGSSSPTPPCFVPKVGTEDINAIRISGEFYPQLNLLFAPAVFGTHHFAVPVKATASVIPMQGIALFDLSRSMVKETHDAMKDGSGTPLLKPNGAPYLHRYGYYLATPNGLAGPTLQDQDWTELETNFPTRGGNTDPTAHFASDYKDAGGVATDITLLNDSDYNGTYTEHHPNPSSLPQFSSAPAVYRMDSRGSGGGYIGPQPYSNLLLALQQTVLRLKNRRVAGSKFGVIFYDDKLSWPRVFSLTDDFDYLLQFLDPTDPNSKFLRSKHKIFPGADAKGTNSPAALSEAARQLFNVNEAGIPASKFVMLMGDGVTNCLPGCPGLAHPGVDRNGNGYIDNSDVTDFGICNNAVSHRYLCVSPLVYNPTAAVPAICSEISSLGPNLACKFSDLDGDGQSGLSMGSTDKEDTRAFNDMTQQQGQCNEGGTLCQNSLPAYMLSMRELQRVAFTQFAPSKTPIHIFPVGRSIMPLTRDIEDPENPGRCLTQSEERVYEGKWKGYPEPLISLVPSGYENIEFPNGNFAMTWPYCTTNVANYHGNPLDYYYCDAGSMSNFVNQSEENPFLLVQMDLYKIAQSTGGVWAPLRPFEPNCTVRGCQPCVGCGEYMATVPISSFATMDPLCEDTQAQVSRYLDEIFGVNPYGLVIENPQ